MVEGQITGQDQPAVAEPYHLTEVAERHSRVTQAQHIQIGVEFDGVAVKILVEEADVNVNFEEAEDEFGQVVHEQLNVCEEGERVLLPEIQALQHIEFFSSI